MATSFMAAVVVTMLGFAVAPHHPITVTNLLARATTYTILVFVAGTLTTLCVLRIMVVRHETRATEVALRTAVPALWLPPLLTFSAQRSWFALVIWAVLAFEVSRLIGFVTKMTEDGPVAIAEHPFQAPMFTFPKQQFVSGFESFIGSVTIQAAVVAAINDRTVLAGLLSLVGTAALVHRGVQMILDSPAPEHRNPAPRTLAVLAVATFVIALAWLPYSLGTGGSGIGENLFAAGKRLLGLPFTRLSRGAGAVAHIDRNKRVEGPAAAAIDVGFTGVILYPEVEPHTKLVAPTITRDRDSGFTRSDSLSIPFYGVYWFWRPPADRPPSSSALRHGSPAVQTFRSVDGAPLWMEARQNLGAAVSLEPYSAIEVVIDNADAFPGTVAMELQLRNTALPGKPSASLGLQEVSVPAGMPRETPAVQTLSFRVPRQIKIGSFDEMTVRFRLKWWRGDKSAKIAIDRFRLVPKG
jgi:hypothetical protein